MTLDAIKNHRRKLGARQRVLFPVGARYREGARKQLVPPAPATLKLASESPEFARTESGNSGGAAAARRCRRRTGPPKAARDGGSGLLTNVKRCISVGPFRDVSEAAHAASTLRGGGYDPRQRVADGEVWAGVWVYCRCRRHGPWLNKRLAKLKAGGIDDALEMPGPNEGSVISLGLYSEPKRAQTRVAQAQALGFNPGIADRKRNGNVYWIDIDLKPTDSLLNPSDLQGESGRIVRLEVKGCPSAGGTDMSGRSAALRRDERHRRLHRLWMFAAFLWLVSVQLYRWFRDGEWTHIGMGDGVRIGLTHCCVREATRRPAGGVFALVESPASWLGMHKVFEVMPASLALFALSIAGNSLYIYCRDRLRKA